MALETQAEATNTLACLVLRVSGFSADPVVLDPCFDVAAYLVQILGPCLGAAVCLDHLQGGWFVLAACSVDLQGACSVLVERKIQTLEACFVLVACSAPTQKVQLQTVDSALAADTPRLLEASFVLADMDPVREACLDLVGLEEVQAA